MRHWKLTAGSVLTAAMLLTPTLSAGAQYDHHHGNFYNGARNGGRGGYYDRGHDYHGDDRYHGHGIGTGQGALIGGAGGAALGALFGGGVKGALIGGAAGAGIGAIAGHKHQVHERHEYYRGNY